MWPKSIGIAVVSFAAGFVASRINWDHTNAPAWVQGVGSVVAIFAAIGLAYFQNEALRIRDEKAAQEELVGMIRSLRSELQTNLEHLDTTVGPMILAHPPNTPFRVTFPLPEDPFHIYKAMLPKFGKITNDTIRDQIVRTYGVAQSFVFTIRFNNELFDDLLSAEENEPDNTARSQKALEKCRKSLTQYGDSVRNSHKAMRDEVTKLLPMLREF